jgi:hypothetical protein
MIKRENEGESHAPGRSGDAPAPRPRPRPSLPNRENGVAMRRLSYLNMDIVYSDVQERPVTIVQIYHGGPKWSDVGPGSTDRRRRGTDEDREDADHRRVEKNSSRGSTPPVPCSYGEVVPRCDTERGDTQRETVVCLLSHVPGIPSSPPTRTQPSARAGSGPFFARVVISTIARFLIVNFSTYGPPRSSWRGAPRGGPSCTPRRSSTHRRWRST